MAEEKRKTAVITGATSGIGAAFARKLAQCGFDLVITGRREDKIRTLAAEIAERSGVDVEVVIAELSDENAVEDLARRISGIRDLEILVNNAGFSIKSLFHEEDRTGHEALIKVHVLAAVRLVHAALPGMIERGRGAVINVSSTSSFTPRPEGAIYAASKCFLNLFSESLHLELCRSGVRIQALCPGLTRTDFHEKLGLRADDVYRRKAPVKAMSPESVVEASLRCLEKNKPICIPGTFNRAAALAVRLMPRAFLRRLLLFRRTRR
ncbi:MAG: SDR family oxidoreductase [Acidobacteriota bacterium]|nr:SDR family oxidoreductase [Acidobacteriota bacterium]